MTTDTPPPRFDDLQMLVRVALAGPLGAPMPEEVAGWLGLPVALVEATSWKRL
jgi:hypothetical protein